MGRRGGTGQSLGVVLVLFISMSSYGAVTCFSLQTCVLVLSLCNNYGAMVDESWAGGSDLCAMYGICGLLSSRAGRLGSARERNKGTLDLCMCISFVNEITF